jgi:hypothetical protein
VRNSRRPVHTTAEEEVEKIEMREIDKRPSHTTRGEEMDKITV